MRSTERRSSEVERRRWLGTTVVFVRCGRARIFSILGRDVYVRCGNWHCLFGVMWEARTRWLA